MGTTPFNFPPGNNLPIGGMLTGTKLGQTAGFPQTVFFTAPVSGIYSVTMYTRIISTDGAGTLNATLTLPTTAPAVRSGPPVFGSDQFQASRVIWFNAGDTARIQQAPTGLGATVYNTYLNAIRIF